MNFNDLIAQRIEHTRSPVCVGLDPYPELFPDFLQHHDDNIFAFCCAIVDATHDLVCAYKPQFAHFAALGETESLRRVIEYIKDKYPDIPVILDAKRGDIGSTATMYAKEAFEIYGADAVTVNPYMGSDTVLPFAEYQDKGVILLCRTSNPGAAQLQNLSVGDHLLYEEVARIAATEWNSNNNLMLVVGATAPEEMAAIRAIAGEMPFLVPGIGAQGGDLAAVINAGRNSGLNGVIINSSRAVLYASSDNNFSVAARAETLKLVAACRKEYGI